jgi:NAD(P) transhydrogenase subunit beta
VPDLVTNLFIFLLATFLGLEVIRRVSPLLHTPLMSITNAISAISLIGSLTLLGRAESTLSTVLGGLAVVASMTNVVSGFLITNRMLKMFKTRTPVAANLIVLPVFLIGALVSGGVDVTKHAFTDITYLAGAVLFILSLKLMNHPKSAQNSVYCGEAGMVLAIIGTLVALVNDPVLGGRSPAFGHIVIALIIGAVLGYPISQVEMTAVPQQTAFSHAFGGLAAGLVGAAEYFRAIASHNLGGPAPSSVGTSIICLEVLLGFITFTGSMIAFGKLAELLPTKPLTYKGQNFVNLILFAVAIVCAVGTMVAPTQAGLFLGFAALSLIFGVLLVAPIGSADMPTVISLLNSYAGLSAGAMGFVLNSPILIIAGALNGSSGFILSVIMCKAMNRSLANVLFGAFGSATTTKAVGEVKPVRSASPEEAASILANAMSVVIVPGYGMAVAQAQHKVMELYENLTKRGVNVRFAIHPVAGRMPGHMNVLLAEADIPYEKLFEMEEINSELPQTDVALVIGANDVTNPAARNDPDSPIYGMPIIDVDKARTVMVIKRSMSSGFAGIDNELYTMDRTLMLFGDAKKFVGEIVKELGSV